MKTVTGANYSSPSFVSNIIGSQSKSDLPDVEMDVMCKVSLDNGIVQVTISKPGGLVTGISYGGIENLLAYNNKETNRGYPKLILGIAAIM